jgi:hemolysin activation/secretion protein
MSYLDRRVLHETTISGIALHHWRMSEGQNLTARVAAVIGSRWMPYSKMVLGASTGLRGYRNYAFFGHRMLLVNIEHRVLSLLRIWFLKVGGVLFFDSGAMWDQDQDLARQRFHSSAGLGLRLNVMGGTFHTTSTGVRSVSGSRPIRSSGSSRRWTSSPPCRGSRCGETELKAVNHRAC